MINRQPSQVMSSAMFPREFDEFEQFRQKYGPVDKLDSKVFFNGMDIAEEIRVEIARGKVLNIQMLAEGKLNQKGEREVRRKGRDQSATKQA